MPTPYVVEYLRHTIQGAKTFHFFVETKTGMWMNLFAVASRNRDNKVQTFQGYYVVIFKEGSR